jgi:lipoate-protein ligase A
VEFVSKVIDPQNKTQLYISKSDDPYLNLSIEHYLLQRTPADSTVLFLYINRPSIIIGRNQNPWNEVNLSAQRVGKSKVKPDLVRRRSGGGTVFHDHGNVNYSVICPTRYFDRDKHARMVVRALQNLGVEKVRVNERHDIELYDTIRQVEYKTVPNGSVPLYMDTVFKISGSAYKLTRLRALHHGTCLVSSNNIWLIPSFLRSPLKPFLKAKGVDSVRSPIQNVQVNNDFGTDEFIEAVAEEFHRLHGGEQCIELGSACGVVPEIAKGMDELKVTMLPMFILSPMLTWSSLMTGYMDKLPRLSSQP